MTVKKLAIISLSRGLLGEPFIKHAEELGFKRLHSYGIEVVTPVKELIFFKVIPKPVHRICWMLSPIRLLI